MNSALQPEPQQVAWRAIGAVALVKVLGHLLVAGRYGFHRDELYFLVCGRHLDFGYVDHPPMAPWIARLAEELFGVSLVGLRLFPILAGGATVLLTGVLAARLGGGRRAQILASLAALSCTFFLIAHHLFQTNPFDTLIWLGGVLLVLEIARRDERSEKLWLAFGLLCGIGLLTKLTILAFGAGVAVSILLTKSLRKHLSQPWIYLGGALAFVVALPLIRWQVHHDWATLEFIRNNSARNQAGPPEFLGLQLGMFGPFSIPLAIAAFVWLWRRRRVLPFFWLVTLTGGLFLVAQSKPYYTNGLYPLLFACGATALLPPGAATTKRWPFVLVLLNLAVLPLFFPLLPAEGYARVHHLSPNGDLGEEIGWPELVDQVAAAWDSLPPEDRKDTILLTGNYGAAGALEVLGDGRGLPQPGSGQNSYYFWSRTRSPSAFRHALVEGIDVESRDLCGSVEPLGFVSNSLGLDNDEAGRAIVFCRDLRLTGQALWTELRRFQ